MDFKLEDVREKRTAPRIRFQGSVQFAFKEPELFGGSLGCDISEGGLRLIVSKFIPLNSELTLMVQLGEESCVECMARVAWICEMPFSENFQVGLEFVKEESQAYDRKDIIQYIGGCLTTSVN